MGCDALVATRRAERQPSGSGGLLTAAVIGRRLTCDQCRRNVGTYEDKKATRTFMLEMLAGSTMTLTELREDLSYERARADRLEGELRRAHQEIAALKIARDTALRIAVWGGRRVEIASRHDENDALLSVCLYIKRRPWSYVVASAERRSRRDR